MDIDLIERLLNNGLVGALLAGGLSNIVSIWREGRQWKRQKDDEELKWQREEQKREKESVRDWYQKSLVNLSNLLTLPASKTQESKDKRTEIVKAIHDWSTFLLLRHSDKTLQKCVDDFVSYPDDDNAELLREKVLEVARREKELFTIDSPTDTSADALVEAEPVKIPREVEITVYIDAAFRKAQLVELGREIPENHQFKYPLSKMLASQRKKLADQYFQSNSRIPDRFTLCVPKKQSETSQNLAGGHWLAALDPDVTEPNQILIDWETAYNQAINTTPHQAP